MAIKVSIRVGDVEVEYEGAEAFLTQKLPILVKELRQVAGAASGRAPSVASAAAGNGTGKKDDPGTLASFLNTKNAKNPPRRRFLATAQWLHLKGTHRISTGDVISALNQSNQNKLSNASVFLKKNIKDGYCEKDGRQFFVTDEGRKALG